MKADYWERAVLDGIWHQSFIPDSSSTRLWMSYRTYEPPPSAGAGPKSHVIQKAMTALYKMGAVKWRDRRCVQE